MYELATIRTESRHSEENIIGAVKQLEGGRKTADVAQDMEAAFPEQDPPAGRLPAIVCPIAKRARCPTGRTAHPLFQPPGHEPGQRGP